MRMKGYLGDIVHYAFSSAFPISSDTVHGSKENGPEATLVSDDKDTYVVRKMIAASKTTVLFGTSLRNLISQSLTNHNVFELGLNLILKDRKGNSVPVVYKGVAADRIARTIRTKDGKKCQCRYPICPSLIRWIRGTYLQHPLTTAERSVQV